MISLLDLQNKLELIPTLSDEDFMEAWLNAVKLHNDLEKLCSEFEKESARRLTINEGKP